MGVLSAQAVINRVTTLLKDPDNTRWTVPELVLWISDAQREIAKFRPDAFVKNSTVALNAGTKQVLPADGVTLMDVVRNMGVNGTTPGHVPRLVSRSILDSQKPNWHTDGPSTEVRHYVYDQTNPKIFYVQPPQPTTSQGRLEINYVAAPEEVTAEGDLVLDDTWTNTVTNYVMHRAWSKDAEDAANAQLAITYYQAFVAQATGKAGSDAQAAPSLPKAKTTPA